MTHQWVSVGEAARRLNVSPSTIRRMIEAGKLVGEREMIGGSKEHYRVRFDAPDAPGEASDMLQAPPPTPSPPDASATPHDASALSERSLDIFSAIFKGNLQIIHEKDAAISRQAEQIADLRERVGRAEARADAAERSLSAAQEAHADCSNLSHAEAARIFEEAREMRAQRDALAADLAEATRRAEEAERPWWRKLWG